MKYQRGDDYWEDGVDYPTFGITVDDHINKIEIHGDRELRDLILKSLIENKRNEIRYKPFNMFFDMSD